MKIQFLEISEENKQKFRSQLRIAYNTHFPNAKLFKKVLITA